MDDVIEVNMFRDDNMVIHIKRPKGKYTVDLITVSYKPSYDQPKIIVVEGESVLKPIKELMPAILS